MESRVQAAVINTCIMPLPACVPVSSLQVSAYYDYVMGLDSDDDLGLEGSDGSEGSSSGSER